MLFKINNILLNKDIPNEIKIRTKNIYGIYRRFSEGTKISSIHDLLSLKIMVDQIENCYKALGLIHKEYHPFNEKFKDYICNPKPNMYKSLHTTVFGPGDRLVQTQIRTFEMDKIASFGLTAYWEEKKGNAREIMQKDLKEKFQFFKSLTEIISLSKDNQEFINKIKSELFSDRIYVYTTKGEIIELPKGATPIDFAYNLSENLGNKMIGVFVNNNFVPVDYILKNNDRIKIITNDFAGPKEDWIDKAKTTVAKEKIKEFYVK